MRARAAEAEASEGSEDAASPLPPTSECADDVDRISISRICRRNTNVNTFGRRMLDRKWRGKSDSLA